jgi:hypothetical protein
MIPLSVGSRSLFSPSSTVSTAGRGNSTVSEAPSSSRFAVPRPSATSSLEIAVTHGRSKSSATIGPVAPFAESTESLPKKIRS